MSESFFQKPMGVASLIGSAIVGPYFYFGGVDSPPRANVPSFQSPSEPVGFLTGYTGQANRSDLANAGTSGAGILGSGISGSGILGVAQQAGMEFTNAPVADFREVLRFDITPAWVPLHFSRVSTVLADTHLDGLRVPFVSGTQSTDVAGSLTYYFDPQQSLRRIQLLGTTGDPTVLVNLMLQYYHLQAEQSLGSHLYTSRWNNRVTSLMQLTPAPVIYSQDTHARYQIFLELNQPMADYAITPEAEQLLRSANLTNRW